jgi:asparagine synthase (glutamine-hydrolysing)
MCGIAGFYGFQSYSLGEIEVIGKKMGSALKHRGPDHSGIWIDESSQLTLIHRRLSILDLSDAGNQPMKSPSFRYIVSYNGEIYNHLDIRQDLNKEFSNIKWLSSSDTETIVIAIELWGIKKAIKLFSGMFAIAVWDKKSKKLFLVRDRAGEKPLYYGWQNDVFLFGSELKTFKQHPSFEGKINRDSIQLQMKYGYVPEPYSIYKNIFKLQPGKILTLDFSSKESPGSQELEDYWSIEEVAILAKKNKFQGSLEQATDSLDEHLRHSISSQMLSDVPIGAFLSGGIDSSLIVSIMQDLSSNPINTFTIGFEESKFNEANYAKEIAQFLGTNHVEHYVTPNEALDVIPKLPYLYDEPFSDSSQIPTFLVSELAKQSVTVSLSGDGGDELFGGYNRHIYSQKWGNIINYTPSSIKYCVAKILDNIKPKQLNSLEYSLASSNRRPQSIQNFSNYFSKVSKALNAKDSIALYDSFTTHWDSEAGLVLGAAEVTPKFFNNSNFSLAEEMMINDFLLYLPNDILVKVDRAAMGLSLETRVPFLQEDVVSFAWSLPSEMKIHNGKGKLILRNLLGRYLPKIDFDRPKQGFAVPIEDWLRGPLEDWAESLLDKTKLEQSGYLNADVVLARWNEHKTGKRNWQTELWDVLMFQSWLESH